MIKMNKKKAILIVFGLCFIILCVLAFLLYQKEGIEIKNSDSYVAEFILEEDNKIYEVKLEEATGKTWLFINGERTDLISIIPTSPLPLLSLPETSEEFDITTREPISELTWKSTLEESKQYLNFIQSQGYVVKRKITTSDYIEVVLQKENIRKRVIIFENTMMTGNLLEDVELPTVEQYLEEYRTLGGKNNE